MKARQPHPRKKTLLIAENDEYIGPLVVGGLKDAGYRTHWVKDGVSALNYILESKPDGVVLDLVLPKLHGFEICAMMRKSQATMDTPIIVISGLSGELDKLQAFDLGADDYVTKPFSIEELVARVDAVLHRPVQRGLPTPFLSAGSI